MITLVVYWPSSVVVSTWPRDMDATKSRPSHSHWQVPFCESEPSDQIAWAWSRKSRAVVGVGRHDLLISLRICSLAGTLPYIVRVAHGRKLSRQRWIRELAYPGPSALS